MVGVEAVVEVEHGLATEVTQLYASETDDLARVVRARRRPARRVHLVIAALAVAALAAVLVRVLLGDYVVALTDLLLILRGETPPDAPGASFIVMEAKLPRALLGLLAGLAFGAAGAIEAIMCTLAVHNGVIPPTINYENPDPACDLDYVPNEAREADVRVALSNAMGLGGHNGCVLVGRVDRD